MTRVFRVFHQPVSAAHVTGNAGDFREAPSLALIEW
jgi:hypothetical protein